MLTFFWKQAFFTGIGICALLISSFPVISCPPVKKSTIPTNHAMTQKIQTFRGLLIYEPLPLGMSVRAYKGEEFFLKINSVNEEKLVLLPSAKVTAADLKSFHNQPVKVTVVYFAGSRPPVNQVACPLDINGQCMVQGEGYQVLSIEPL